MEFLFTDSIFSTNSFFEYEAIPPKKINDWSGPLVLGNIATDAKSMDSATIQRVTPTTNPSPQNDSVAKSTFAATLPKSAVETGKMSAILVSAARTHPSCLSRLDSRKLISCLARNCSFLLVRDG